MNAKTWCPQCGPSVAVDEDGCCATCGADAVGGGADLACANTVQRDSLAAAALAVYDQLAHWVVCPICECKSHAPGCEFAYLRAALIAAGVEVE